MNDFAHTATGATSGLTIALLEKEAIKANPELLLAAPVVGKCFGKLPDIVDPAFKNQNHRQLFHSLAFLVLGGYGLKKVYDW